MKKYLFKNRSLFSTDNSVVKPTVKRNRLYLITTGLLLTTLFFSCTNKNSRDVQILGSNIFRDLSITPSLSEKVSSKKIIDTTKEEKPTTIKASSTPPPEKKLTLDEIYLLAEQKNKLEFFIKDDIQKTSDGNGLFIKYKSKDDEGIVIYKNDDQQAYWVHSDIYKSFIHSGALQNLGYPVGDPEYLFEDKLKKTVTRQKFEKGRLFFFDDPDLDSFYESILLKKYSDSKVDEIDFSFKNKELPIFSQKTGGKEGDPVNVIIVAKNQSQVEKAFEDAKWVKPEFGFKNISFSALELFGRKQDLGYARETSNIFTLYKKRHHVRFWKSEIKENNNEVWIAGATEDVEVKFKDKLLRKEEKANNSVDKKNPLTHKIDPDIDREIEYVKNTVLEKNDKIKSFYIKHPNIKDPFIESLNGSNDLILWDGRILVLDITSI